MSKQRRVRNRSSTSSIFFSRFDTKEYVSIGFISGGVSKHNFPLVRRSGSLAIPGRSESLAKLPKLMSLELFNPETDDVDSDSSGVSSPDSISSVISVLTEELSVCSQGMWSYTRGTKKTLEFIIMNLESKSTCSLSYFRSATCKSIRF